MNSNHSFFCCSCRRKVDLCDLTVFEGRDYHDTCYLSSVRSRIAALDTKAHRGTATVLDASELGDLRFIENEVQKDIINKCDFGFNSTKLVFLGHTALGNFSQMNPPLWKHLLARGGSLDGTKYHLQKMVVASLAYAENFKILTDENGHKYCVHVGCCDKNNIIGIESGDKPLLPLHQNTVPVQLMEKKEVNQDVETSVH